MSDCWKCGEGVDRHDNYCTECPAPQKSTIAARSFTRHANDFTRGLNGLLDLVDGCPELLAEGLAEMDGYEDITEAEWKRRFENSLRWIRAYFARLWFDHYNITEADLDELIEEHKDKLDDTETDTGSLPTPTNETCSCGTSMPDDAPAVITQWKEASEATAVCFDCFGQISSRLSLPD